ncbi:MAG: MoaD/ThiS family protein [Candidatus Asgardarchaeia archaeon]
MVKVKVLFFATLRDEFGVREVEVECDGTLEGLVNALAEKLSPKIREEILDDKTSYVRDDIIFLVNGINIKFAGGKNVRFKDGDTIAIFPPVGGGYLLSLKIFNMLC